MYYMIICDWCDGRGFHIEVRDGGLYHLTCTYCNGAGREIVFPPADIVKIKGLTDGQQTKNKTDTEEGNQE